MNDETEKYKEVKTDLISIRSQAGELLVDSRDVARVFNVEHSSLRKLIEQNEVHLSQLGVYRFQIAKPPVGSAGGRPEKFAFLNFDQVAFLLTLTRITKETIKFRLQLILAFKKAREELKPVDTLLLAIPEVWQKTFPDNFYIALLKIYGGEFNRSKNKPSWVGSWTNKFIYEPIYHGLSQELKRKRSQYVESTGKDCDWIRLHQFLEENAKDALRDTISKVTAILQISEGKQSFAEHYVALYGGAIQMKIEDLLKDPSSEPTYFDEGIRRSTLKAAVEFDPKNS